MVVFRRKIGGTITAWWEWLRGEVDELELGWLFTLGAEFVGSGNLIFPPLTIHSRTLVNVGATLHFHLYISFITRIRCGVSQVFFN